MKVGENIQRPATSGVSPPEDATLNGPQISMKAPLKSDLMLKHCSAVSTGNALGYLSIGMGGESDVSQLSTDWFPLPPGISQDIPSRISTGTSVAHAAAMHRTRRRGWLWVRGVARAT